MTYVRKKIIYFRDLAKELGCVNVESLGDLEVWQYIINHKEK